MLSGVIGFENLSSGMGTTAYVAFMASITNKKFTAIQYALLSSLMGIPRVLGSVPVQNPFDSEVYWRMISHLEKIRPFRITRPQKS